MGCCRKIKDKFQASGKEAGGYGTGKHGISGGVKSDLLVYVEGTRVEDEPNYHCHEHLELCYINPGQESTESAIRYMK